MAIVRISGKHQVVIPKEARKSLGLSAGDQLIVEVEDGKIVMRPRPKSYTDYMMGLGEKLWKGVDATKYIRKERESWKKV